MDTQLKRLPGYSNELFNPNSTKTGDPPSYPKSYSRRCSWVVRCFPYMEEQPLWDQWNTFGTSLTAAQQPAIAGLTCPTTPPETQGNPWLAYVGNAGWAFSDSTRGGDTNEYAANGVFFDLNKNINVGPQDGREKQPAIQMSMTQIVDGTSKTLMLSENLHTFYWTYGLDNDNSAITDGKLLFGFVWKSKDVATEIDRINGDKFYDKIPAGAPVDMESFAKVSDYSTYESYAYPSSRHPGGVNVAFCGGNIEFMREQIDPTVYGQLMTSNSKRSKLQAGGKFDRQLPQPSDEQYRN